MADGTYRNLPGDEKRLSGQLFSGRRIPETKQGMAADDWIEQKVGGKN